MKYLKRFNEELDSKTGFVDPEINEGVDKDSYEPESLFFLSESEEGDEESGILNKRKMVIVGVNGEG